MTRSGDLLEASDGAQPTELIGLSTWVGVARHAVTGESVRRFWSALSPGRHRDTETGQVPPTYFCPDPVAEVERMGLVRLTKPPRSIDGGSEWFPGHPPAIGDMLTSVGRVIDVEQRQARDGRALVETTVEIRSWNQDGLLAGVARGTILNYQERSHGDG
jgi:hypothetical protein